MKRFLIACAVLALAPACARTQRLIINTNMQGAQISIVKRGELRTRGNIAGVVDIGVTERYENPPLVIGTGSLIYDFPVVEESGGWGVGASSVDMVRVCREVEIRAYNGAQYAQQIVPVTGDVAQVFLNPSPAPQPPPGQPAPAHSATPVQPGS